MRIIAEQMNQEFSIAEIVQFSGFVIIEHDYEGLRQFQSEVNIEHGALRSREIAVIAALNGLASSQVNI